LSRSPDFGGDGSGQGDPDLSNLLSIAFPARKHHNSPPPWSCHVCCHVERRWAA
jgi:hypothetical protein